MDVFARGWSPSVATRAAFWLVVGVTLVTLPMWGSAAGVGQPEYVYEVSPVTFVSGDAQFENGQGLRDPTLGIDCFFGPRFDRTCAVEQAAVDADVEATLSASFVHDDPYVANPNTGQMYRRTASDDAGSGEYGLVPVSDETAIRDVAREWDRATPWVKRAVRADETQVGVSRPIDYDRHDDYHTLFVERGDDVYVVSQRFTRESLVDEAAGTVHVLGVVVGLLAFRRGVRLRSE